MAGVINSAFVRFLMLMERHLLLLFIPRNLKCSWIITTEHEDETVKLQMMDVDIEQSEGCENASITMYNSNSSDGKLRSLCWSDREWVSCVLRRLCSSSIWFGKTRNGIQTLYPCPK